MTRLIIALLAAMLALAAAAAQDDDPATRQFDFANGLYIRGKAFFGQAAEQYRIFLRDYPDDPRCDDALFRLAECYRQDGKAKGALKTLEEHAQRFPSSDNAGRVTFRTGQVLHELGKHGEAIAAFRKTLSGSANPALKEAAGYHLGRTLLEAGKSDEAIEVFQEIAEGKPGKFTPFALYQLGLAHADRGAEDEAVKRFRQLAEMSTTFAPEALFRIGEIEFKRNRYAEAAAAYRAVTEKHAGSRYAGAAAYGLVQSLVRAKQYAKAISAHEMFKTLVPEPVRPQTNYLVANAHYELGQHKKAFGLYKEVVRAAPKTELGAKAEFKMAWCRFFLRDFEALAATGTKFLDEHPRYPDADKMHYLVGEAFLQLKRPQDALVHYETILNDYADSEVHLEADFKLGWCLFQKGAHEEARRRFLGYADAHPDDPRAPEALARAAECSIKLVKMADAAEEYRRLLDDYPESALAEGARFQLGLAYVSLDEQERAVETFLDFVKRYPDSAHASDAYYWIGSQKQKAGKPDEAIGYLTRSIETAKEDRFVARARYKLATTYHGQGKYDDAAALLLEMLKADREADVPAATHLWVAGYLLERERFDKARFLYAAYFEKFPKGLDLEQAHFGLGECLRHDEKWPEALGHYRKAIAFAGSLKLLAELHAADCLFRLGKDDEAVALVAELVKAENPGIESEALYRLGMFYLSRAQKEKDPARSAELFEEAQQHFLRVVILYGNADKHPECMLRAAQCLEARGQADEADKQYRELVEAHPDSAAASEAREKLGLPEAESN